MIVRYTICIAACAMLLPEVVNSQTSRPSQRPSASSTSRRSMTPPGQTRTRQRGGVPGRPGAGQAPTKPEPVDPKLERLLREWEVASSKITRLSGKHKRRVYDLVFKVEKQSTGVFHHEVPDKGRIDIEPVKVAKDAKSDRKDPDTGKPFALVGDLQEKWICDGKRIVEINEVEKTATFMPIPPQGQGENIMNGPLPFLFGMKAEKAKQRYKLRLLGDKVNPRTKRREIIIQAFPRWATDGENWHEARIILDHPTFLPLHVKLVDSAKTKETVFSFSNLKVNKVGLAQVVFGKTPFKPNLRTYKINTLSPGKGKKTPPPIGPDEVLIPDIATWPIEDAKARLGKMGLSVAPKLVRGGPAPNAKLIHRVRTLTPSPNTVVKRGSVVKLVVFERPQTASRK